MKDEQNERSLSTRSHSLTGPSASSYASVVAPLAYEGPQRVDSAGTTPIAREAMAAELEAEPQTAEIDATRAIEA